MFGLKIAIGAVDNTTAALRGIGSRLKQFSRNVRTWLNLAGFTMIASKLGSALDSALSASSYATEWDQFKERMGRAWTEMAGRIGDLFGPLIDDAESIGTALINGVNGFIKRIQYAISFWKRAAPTWMGGKGESFDKAATGATADVAVKDAERITRIRERRRQTTVEENAGINARGRVDPRWMTRPTTLAERIKLRRTQLENQSALSSTVMGQVGLMNERLGRSGPDGTFVSHGFGMNKTASGFKRYRDTAEAKAERKWQRKVDEARRKESHGVRLSAKMQAVLDQDNADQQAKRDAADKKARDQAILETADNTKRVADTLAGGLSIPPEGGW